MLDWDDVRVFLAIARRGSLSAAARTLGVNHSTVFRRLHGLQDRLGTQLFQRLPGGYALTPVGEAMLAEAGELEERMAALERRVAGHDLRPSGSVRLTTTTTLAHHFLLPRLAGFRRRYPDITVELITGNVFFDLTRREADIALRPSDDPPEHLVGRRLGRVHWAAYAARAYLHERTAPDSAATLAGHALIGPDDSLAGLPAARWLHRHGLEPALRSNDVQVQLGAVQAGLGIAWLPCFMADDTPGLVRVLPPLPELASDLWLLTHPDLRRSARIHVLWEYLVEVAARDWPTAAGAPD